MASPLDAPLRDVSAQLLGQFGTQVTLTRTTDGEYWPSGRKVVGESEESQTVSALLEKYKARYGEQQTPETVQAGDRKLTIPAQGLDWPPAVGQTATFEGHDHEILHVHPIYSGEQVALYELHARR